jgi:hypothetical protein
VDHRLVVYVDGKAAYRTGNGNEGLWVWRHGDGDGWEQFPDGHTENIRSWHQIVGYCQISGRAEVRSWVVDELATQEW